MVALDWNIGFVIPLRYFYLFIENTAKGKNIVKIIVIYTEKIG